MASESQPGSVNPEAADDSPWSPPSVAQEYPQPEQTASVRLPWGPWATIGWTVVWIVVISAAQILGALVFAFLRGLTHPFEKVDSLVLGGNVLIVATLFTTIATLALVALLVVVRQYPIRDYLALYWPPLRSVLGWTLGLVALQVATDLTSYLLGRPLVPESIVEIYRTAWLPGLVLAFVVLAPLGEEIFFRGFLYMGIAASRAGPNVAIAISTVIFALLHALQYDWYGVLAVGTLGLFLGSVRKQTGSVLLTMFFHAVSNAVGTLEIMILES